jgi:glycosyltransferase involved in cell wall biosynthesis
MKLLICVSEYPPDYSAGIGNVAYNVVERLKKKGIECTVCSPNADIKLGSSWMIAKFGRLGLLYYWHQVSKYFKKRAEDYDLVWLHNPLFIKNSPFKNSLVTMHITAHGQIIQRIYSLHIHIYKKVSSLIERHSLNKIKKARFTAVSQQVCKELEEIGINKERITYIPNGVDTEQFKPSNDKKLLRKKFKIPENDLIFLSLGRLTEAKQPQKLIEVFSEIEKEKKDVSLVIAGEGELLEKTRKFVRQKRLKKVRFLGYVDEKDKPDLYACSNYYIITSKYEGQPLTLLEAMASGLPCIVSDIPNLRIVEDANCGIIVNFNDEENATQEMISYLEGDNSEDSKNAREYAVNKLDWEIIAEKYLEGLAHHLSQIDDIELHLITFGSEKKELKNGNLRIHMLKRWLPWYFHLPFEVMILRREVLKINPDIVHAHESCMPYSTAAALLSKKYLTLLTMHMVIKEWIRLEGESSILTRLITLQNEKYVLSKLRNVIAVSPYVKDLIGEMTQSKIYVVSNGVDFEDVENIRQYQLGRHIIFYVGMLEKRKGVDILIRAISIIKKEIPDAHLFIAGIGEEEINLKNLVKELDIEDNVKFLGFISEEEKYSYYKSTDLCVFPSRFEWFGIILLEAMACGKPIVASNVGGIPYVVEDGKTGLLFESENVDDLAEKIITLLKDKELRDKMGKAGKGRVKEFTWEKVAERTVEVYKEIMNI